jgi:uncharacterized protein YfcZ (UPF0381/DUF406 family)
LRLAFTQYLPNTSFSTFNESREAFSSYKTCSSATTSDPCTILQMVVHKENALTLTV